MLFDIAPFRAKLPKCVTVFASGSSRPSELRGFQRLAIPPGVSVPELNEEAILNLIQANARVFVDSGAFSEVSITPTGIRVTKLITDLEWRRRLAIYLRLAQALHGKALLVAPDQVGSQTETISRLARYKPLLQEISLTGATFVIPLQVGEMTHAQFLDATTAAAGVELIPAFPLKKATTSTAELLDFVATTLPLRIHLLGMGAENRRAKRLLELIRHCCPECEISMDSNRLRAVTGKDRPMSIKEAELRAEEVTSLYGEVESSSLALIQVRLDYTDSISVPGTWASKPQLGNIAAAAGLSRSETGRLLSDPDSFLQEPIDGFDGLSWIEHPLLSPALDRAWEEFVTASVQGSVREASVSATFRGSLISGQSAA